MVPAIKALSEHVHKTTQVTSVFKGYKIPAGTFTDRQGRKWQYQVSAVVAKSEFMKKDEVLPLVSKWAIGLKIRVFIKYLIDWSQK